MEAIVMVGASKTSELDEPQEDRLLAAGVSLLGLDQTLPLSETLGSGPHPAAL